MPKLKYAIVAKGTTVLAETPKMEPIDLMKIGRILSDLSVQPVAKKTITGEAS